MILSGSYANGFAPRDGRPLYPELWRGCVGAWSPCLGPTGLTLRDWGGLGLHAEVTGGGSIVPSGGRYALFCDGVDDQASVSIPSSVLSSGFTISFWANAANTWGGTAATRYPIGYGSNENLGFTNQHVAGTYSGAFFMRGSGVYPVIVMSPAPAANTWVHVAGSWDGATMRLYVNGTLHGTASNTTFGTVTGTNFTIGRGSASSTAFPGLVDNVMAFNRPLNAKAILLLSLRRGIAHELAPRRRTSVAVQFNRRRRLLVGAHS